MYMCIFLLYAVTAAYAGNNESETSLPKDDMHIVLLKQAGGTCVNQCIIKHILLNNKDNYCNLNQWQNSSTTMKSNKTSDFLDIINGKEITRMTVKSFNTDQSYCQYTIYKTNCSYYIDLGYSQCHVFDSAEKNHNDIIVITLITNTTALLFILGFMSTLFGIYFKKKRGKRNKSKKANDTNRRFIAVNERLL